MFACVVAITACISGCVESEVSLSDPDTAVVDEGLVGRWVDPKGKVVCFAAIEDEGFPKGMMKFWFTEDTPPLIIWTTQLADNTFVNIPFTRAADGKTQDVVSVEEYAAWVKAKSSPVRLLMVRKQGDTLLFTGPTKSQTLTLDRKKLLATLASTPELVFDGKVPTKLIRERSGDRDQPAQASNSDARLLLLAIHHASQAHLTCKALGTMATNNAPDAEIRQVLDPLATGLETVAIPLIKRELEEKADDPDASSLLEDIIVLQESVLAEAKAIEQYALVDRSMENATKFGRAKLAYEKQRTKLTDVMTRIGQRVQKASDEEPESIDREDEPPSIAARGSESPTADGQGSAPPARGAGDWFQQAAKSRGKPWEKVDVLTPSLAKAAVDAGTDLFFYRLTLLTPEIAEILATSRHSLSFPALTAISPQTAEKLAVHRGGPSDLGLMDDDALELTGLTSLPDDVAIALAERSSGVLQIGSKANPIPTITTNAAEALSESDARVLEIHIKSLSEDGQEALSWFSGSLILPELTRIECDVLLAQLVRFKGGAILGVESLNPEQARIIVDSGNIVLLQNVTRVDRETAIILSEVRSELSLLGLKECPEESRTRLARNKNIALP